MRPLLPVLSVRAEVGEVRFAILTFALLFAPQAAAQALPTEPSTRSDPAPAPAATFPAVPERTNAEDLPIHGGSTEAAQARSASSRPARWSPRATHQRLLLGAVAGVEATTASTLLFALGDRMAVADPGVALGAAALVALGGIAIGGLVDLAGGRGPALTESIEPPTVAMGVIAHGSSVSGESDPYEGIVEVAPTLRFPSGRGHLRLLGSLVTGFGARTERDPRPQMAEGGSVPAALEVRTQSVMGGLEVALRPRRGRRGRAWEFRYKPQAVVANERLTFADGEQRVSRRTAVTPLTFGTRMHITPRQRYTVYLGPRWDFLAYGRPGALDAGRPLVAPAYGETWYDIDLPFPGLGKERAVSQITFGYVHSRFGSQGLNVRKVVGFLGLFVARYAVRWRPRGAKVAYQLDLGAEVGSAVSPFVRWGVVLPSWGDGG